MKPERLIGPEHLSGGDAKQERVSDVPGGAVTATLIGVFMAHVAMNILLN
jgi:hypothetical protein